MTRADLLRKLSEILGEILEDDSLALTEDTKAEDVENWDSTNHVRLIVSLESEFRIRFDVNEIGAPQTVGQLASLIERKMATA